MLHKTITSLKHSVRQLKQNQKNLNVKFKAEKEQTASRFGHIGAKLRTFDGLLAEEMQRADVFEEKTERKINQLARHVANNRYPAFRLQNSMLRHPTTPKENPTTMPSGLSSE